MAHRDGQAELVVGQVVAVGDARGDVVAATQPVEVKALVADGDGPALGQAGRSPVLPGEVTAERRGQAPRRPVQREGAGLAVVLGEDRRRATLRRSPLAPPPGALGGNPGPADLVLVEAV